MSEKVLFQFSGSDSGGRHWVFIGALLIASGGGLGPILHTMFHIGMLKAILYPFGIAAVIAIGLRNAIVVMEGRVTITKRWFFIPYWRWSALVIERVWLGDDEIVPGIAVGLVVQLGKSEVHIGSSCTMDQLYEALRPLSVSGRWQPPKAVSNE